MRKKIHAQRYPPEEGGMLKRTGQGGETRARGQSNLGRVAGGTKERGRNVKRSLRRKQREIPGGVRSRAINKRAKLRD